MHPSLSACRREVGVAGCLSILSFQQNLLVYEEPIHNRRLGLVVFTDSQHALRAIQAGNNARTGRELLQKISRHTVSFYKAGIDLQFRWSPGYSGIIGNEQADKVVRDTSSQEDTPTVSTLERVREVVGIIRLINRDRSDNPTPFDAIGLPG
jgi:hypothetical protein